jgi:formate dehydrogenase maturation protein FdhE
MKFYNYQPTLKCPICGFEHRTPSIIVSSKRHLRYMQCDGCEEEFVLVTDVSIKYSAWETNAT